MLKHSGGVNGVRMQFGEKAKREDGLELESAKVDEAPTSICTVIKARKTLN